MSKLKVSAFSISLDGFSAGPDQSLKDPLGKGGMQIMTWMTVTKTFHKSVLGRKGGVGGVDDEFARRSMKDMGAWIMGRNMFGPIRGRWPNEDWKGWWGDSPPYHVPVFVLTHYERAPIEMKGGTTFYFVTDGIKSALKQAQKAAGKKDIRIGGGVSTVRQYLQAGLVDELHLAQSPVLLGAGENLLGGIDLVRLGYRVVKSTPSPKANHILLRKS